MKHNFITVDEQKLFLLKPDQWWEILDNGIFDEFEIDQKLNGIIHQGLRIVNNEADLHMALGKISNKWWLPYFLLKTKTRWQRIALLKRHCSNCDWFGFVGLPNVIDNYIGIPIEIDKFDLMKLGDSIPEAKCPCCNTSFDDRVIWTE